MIRYCQKKWDKNKGRLESALRAKKDLDDCKYRDLVCMVVEEVLNEDDDPRTWNAASITEIDDGDYQGTLLFLIPMDAYQPAEYEYMMTFVGYGSCSGCDTLLSIQSRFSYASADEQIKDYMTLCRDIVANMIKPYNCGWRNEEEYDPVEYKTMEDDKHENHG